MAEQTEEFDFDSIEPPTAQQTPANYVPYNSTGLDNKIIGIDDKVTKKFDITYDNQLSNLDDKDYKLACLVGKHLQTLKTIENQLGEDDCLHDLKREYSAKNAFMLAFSKSKGMAMLKGIKSQYMFGKQKQELTQTPSDAQPKPKKKILGIPLPI